MPSSPHILLIASKHLRENPCRDLVIKGALEARGARVTLALLGPRLSAFGYGDLKALAPFQQAGAVWINSALAYASLVRRADAVLLGTWKTNKHLVQIAMALGKLTLEHDAAGGIDHWTFGSDALLVKGAFSQRHAEWMFGPQYPATDFQSTGTILYERPPELVRDRDRDAFFQHYGLDPDRRTAAFFPKAAKLFHDKLIMWFKEDGEAHHRWYRETRIAICKAVEEAGYNLILKLHPAAYAGYRTEHDLEQKQWAGMPWVKVLEPDDTFALFQHMDVGIGIVTHSALDTGFWRKPFIYVDSDIAPVIEAWGHRNKDLLRLPPGPSTRWERGEEDSQPYHFPTWVGGFARRETLAEVLSAGSYDDPDPAHYAHFIREFWHADDGKAGERIADQVLTRLDAHHPRPVAWKTLAVVARTRLNNRLDASDR